MTSNACDRRTKSAKSAMVPVRLPRCRSLTLGGPATGANTTCRPPTRQERCGFLAMRLASAGTLLSAAAIMPASRRTIWLDSSTLAPAAASIERPRGDNTRIPKRSSIPIAARCRLSTWSSENSRSGSKGFSNCR